MSKETKDGMKGSRAVSQSPKKRFRIEKLEERIAPKAHFNPQSKLVGDGNGDGGGGGQTSSGTVTVVGSIY